MRSKAERVILAVVGLLPASWPRDLRVFLAGFILSAPLGIAILIIRLVM